MTLFRKKMMIAIQEIGIVNFSENLLKQSKDIRLRPWYLFGSNPLSNLARKAKELEDFIEVNSKQNMEGASDKDLLIARGNLLSLKLNISELYYRLGFMLMGIVAFFLVGSVLYTLFYL